MRCIINDPSIGGLVSFSGLQQIISTHSHGEVLGCLEKVDYFVNQGFYAAGFLTYEAAPAFDSALTVHTLDQLPLICFGIFSDFEPVDLTDINQDYKEPTQWNSQISWEEYFKAIRKIKKHIKEGNTYQVNFTFKLLSRFSGYPESFFLNIQNDLQAEYACFVELEQKAICSFSPELFFGWKNGNLVSKPMKGTSPRGKTLEEDVRFMSLLSLSKKNRSENVMIVDMIRNDMGRIADKGTVKVESFFDVERFPYVLQMTSTVSSTANASIPELFKALFPCASITGAPKFKTMEIIKQLEPSPRGVYTGSIGYISPEKSARFNVAIRTLLIDKKDGKCEYGVGSGIVWDSNAEDEFNECLVKADFLQQTSPKFDLIESMLWKPEIGYFLLEDHLERLHKSAIYFGFRMDRSAIIQQLMNHQSSMPEEGAKVRLILEKSGLCKVEAESLNDIKSQNLKVCLSDHPVKSSDRFLYHKTTHRLVYDNARQSRPDCDDVILWNEKEQITESCRSNVVIELEGRLVTPPIFCGLLGGTFRNHLIKSGELVERIVTKEQLKQATRIFTINSVRKWMNVQLVD